MSLSRNGLASFLCLIEGSRFLSKFVAQNTLYVGGLGVLMNWGCWLIELYSIYLSLQGDFMDPKAEKNPGRLIPKSRFKAIYSIDCQFPFHESFHQYEDLLRE